MSFNANLTNELYADDASFSAYTKDLAPETHEKLAQARNRIRTRKYRLLLYYVTSGKCSRSIREDAARVVNRSGAESGIDIVDGQRLLLVLSDYLDGVAPPVPTLDLEIESGKGQGGGILQRYDKETDIESWVFSITDRTVSELYERAGSRLFARNIRGFLGSTEINDSMAETLRLEPEYFWYYNNGITLICDDAERVSSRGRDVLRVSNPQVINGQQTTRTLSRHTHSQSGASALARVIRVSRNGEGPRGRYDLLVSKIVSATNKQNAISPADLMANDRRQVEIERQLRKLGYWYIRKRQTKSEAKRSAGAHHRFMIKKEELAQAVAGCELDPSIVRAGKQKLFEERWYPVIFPTGDPMYYLTRYWLMREVSYAASGYPERAYAKWLVLNFMHAHLSRLLRSRATVEAFGRARERNIAPIGVLNRAINAVFTAALKFYRARRGKGAKALDVSTFFKRKGLHRDFRRFWRGSSNKSRGTFGKTWRRFQRELEHEASK